MPNDFSQNSKDMGLKWKDKVAGMLELADELSNAVTNLICVLIQKQPGLCICMAFAFRYRTKSIKQKK